MIARLTGILQEVNLTQCIIDVNGVGYLVAIPLSTFDRLPRIGKLGVDFVSAGALTHSVKASDISMDIKPDKK